MVLEGITFEVSILYMPGSWQRPTCVQHPSYRKSLLKLEGHIAGEKQMCTPCECPQIELPTSLKVFLFV